MLASVEHYKSPADVAVSLRVLELLIPRGRGGEECGELFHYSAANMKVQTKTKS